MTNDQVYNAVIQWIHLITGLHTQRAYTGIERPADNYIAVNLLAVEALSRKRAVVFAETGETTPEGKAETTVAAEIEKEWRLSIHAYGPQQDQALNRLADATEVFAARESLEPLVPFSVSAIRTIPEKINGNWESRANMDFAIRGVVADGFLTETIETYEKPEFVRT